VLEVVSAKVSAVPNRNMTTSTTAMFTQPVTIVIASIVRTTVRIRSTATTTRRRSSRSAMTPAFSPKSSHGRRWSSTAIATSSGSLVCEATSSQQRTGGQRDSVAQIADPRGREQPAEAHA
jgi:hypothetical protein